jgi:ferrous iron transport protein A
MGLRLQSAAAFVGVNFELCRRNTGCHRTWSRHRKTAPHEPTFAKYVYSMKNVNERQSHLHSRLSLTFAPNMLLTDLPNGTHATVAEVRAGSSDIDAVSLHRLGELGFIPGEPVQLLRRGPGGREPLAVLVGETLFALRWVEAQCIEVSTP